MDWKEYELSNGIRMIFKKNPDFHTVAVGVFVKAGSRTENDITAGISHFIEHMLFKGTKKRTCNQIKEEIEGIGGLFNAFTSEEITCYWVKILQQYIEKTFDVLSDMIKNPALKEKDIEKERMVILEEIRMYKDIPARYIYEVFDSIVFSGHHLARPIAGTEETVKKIKRKDMEQYMEQFYNSSNIVISIAGNFSEKEIKQLGEKYFGLKHGQESTFEEYKRKEKGPKAKILIKETEQTHMVMGGIAYAREDPRKYPLGVLNVILGGNMSSRLFNKIREEMGLAYDIRSSTKSHADTGAFLISAGVNPANSLKATEAIVEELIKVREKGITDNELERAKKYLISHTLMELEGNLEYMMFLGEQKILKKKMETVNEIIENIEKVSRKDVEDVAKEIFTQDNYHFAMIGPKGKEEEFLKVAERLK